MSDVATTEKDSRISAMMIGTEEPRFRYSVYGISVLSDIELLLPPDTGSGIVAVEVVCASEDAFQDALAEVPAESLADWYCYAQLGSGATYVSWRGVGKFLVSSDGQRIHCRRDLESSWESFQVYLLGQALSFALVRSGLEPLHATVLVVDGIGFALLGESGFGKSTLAASFIAAGHRLLTDDQLVLMPAANTLAGYPGPARVKLFPEIAQRFMQPAAVVVPMNPETKKLIIPLKVDQRQAFPVPVVALYDIVPPEDAVGRVDIVPLSGREAFLAISSNTFNHKVSDPQRMKRQLFATREIISRAAVRKLSYPRDLDQLPLVQQSILADLAILKTSRTGEGQQ